MVLAHLDGASRVGQLRTWRAALEAARMSGTLSVQYGDGSRVQYRSDAEIVAAIATIDREFDVINGTTRRGKSIVFTTSKGL